MKDPHSDSANGDFSDHGWLFHGLGVSCDPIATIHYREMVEVSDALMAGYVRLVRQGMPCEMVGYAMLGATINLYDMFGMPASLPQILRSLADRIEQKKDS